MSDWLLNLPLIWVTVVIFGGTYLFAPGELGKVDSTADCP
jgi:hypothetical protein